MAFYCVSHKPFTNKLGQVIEPNTNIYVVTSTKGVTVREGNYLGMFRGHPFVSVHYKDDRNNEIVRTFAVKSGNIYLRTAK